MMLIGLPSTLPPKSSTAICAAVTEPWPVGVDAGPFISVRTPILTTSSEIWASAAGAGNIAAASAPSMDIFLADITGCPPKLVRRIGRIAWPGAQAQPVHVLAIILRPASNQVWIRNIATDHAANR